MAASRIDPGRIGRSRCGAPPVTSLSRLCLDDCTTKYSNDNLPLIFPPQKIMSNLIEDECLAEQLEKAQTPSVDDSEGEEPTLHWRSWAVVVACGIWYGGTLIVLLSSGFWLSVCLVGEGVLTHRPILTCRCSAEHREGYWGRRVRPLVVPGSFAPDEVRLKAHTTLQSFNVMSTVLTPIAGA